MILDKSQSEQMEKAYSIIKQCSSDSQHYLSFNEENFFSSASRSTA